MMAASSVNTCSFYRSPRRFLFFLALIFPLTCSVVQADDDITVLNEPESVVAETAEATPPTLLETLATQLIDGGFDERSDAIKLISEKSNTDALPLLSAMQNGNLLFDANSRNIYLEQAGSMPQVLNDELQLVPADSAIDTSNLDRVRINNRLRIQLRQTIAVLQLGNPDTRIRLQAVRNMLNKLDEDSLAQISTFRAKETNGKVESLMDIALAIGTLQQSEDNDALRAAIATLGDSLEPIGLNALRNFSENTASSSLKKAANEAINSIENKHGLFEKLETLFFGLSFGSVLVLAGIGLAITFGVMGVINMAHGELIMLGAYTTFVIQQLMPNMIGLSIIVAIPAAFIVSALAGIAMERLVIRHLYGRPLETLLATFGISLILQQAVRSIFSPLNRSVVTPDWMSGLWQINSIFAITWNRLYIIIFCLMVFTALVLIMKKSALGLQVRAVSQNRLMARSMGVRSTRVDILTFGLGSGIAGVAGVALSLLTNVGPNLGQSYIIDSFIVVVFGGVGNLFGTLVAGMSLGVANKILEPWAGAVLAKILLLLFIVLFIQKRPQGLFPQRGRAVEG